jgi:tRNA threonylcarbamoyladenosine biosynthesis protein TsaE
MKIEINNISDLNAAAKDLMAFAGGHKIFAFDGEMGAGKTTFIKVICKYLGVEDLVSSPTFSLVNEYDAKGTPLYHFDFYRIKDISEAYDIGYEEYFYSGSICFIEWPEKVEELLPIPHINVLIELVDQEKRTMIFSKIEN